jgi:hypothetical protein
MAYISFKPSDYFNTTNYSGNSSTQTITTGLANDMVWLKVTNITDNNVIFDSVRGVNKKIITDNNAAEGTSTAPNLGVTAFNSTSFDLGAWSALNGSGNNYSSMNWRAGTTTGKTTVGETITPSAYSINPTSGIGIYKYTGTGSNGTIAHGLSSAPKFVIGKRIVGSTGDWNTWHTACTSGTYYVNLNVASAETGWTTTVYTAEPTSTVINLGTYAGVNASTHTYLIYAFAPVKGYSAIGKYIGNGSATDGTFVYTGFEPAMVIIKAISGSGAWGLYTTHNVGYNPTNKPLTPNSTDALNSTYVIDMYSNGFKPFHADAQLNASGVTYAYYAVAKNPIVGTNGTAGVAR